MATAQNRIHVDLRECSDELQCPVVLAVLDRIMATGCQDHALFVFEHDPTGLCLKSDMRKETRGCFEHTVERRSDGAWVVFFRPSPTARRL